MSKTKSTTEFDHMLQKVGLTHLKHMFEAPKRAWTSAAAFAFAAGHNPNSVSPQRLSQFVVRPLLELPPGDEDDDEHGKDGAAIRELFFDCARLVLADKTRAHDKRPQPRIWA